MAHIEAFRGIRYSLANGCDISDRLAPPYDVIVTDQAKRNLLDRSRHNIVAIDLPHTPPATAGPEYLYHQAGELLNTWLSQKIFIRDLEPAIYLYRQTFSHDGKKYIRRGFIGRLRLEELGKGSILPHEQTYSGPKEDRLLLTKHTRAYTSQIFCLYEDRENEIADTLYTRADASPDYHGTVDGVGNELWVITERRTRQWLGARMEDRSVFIADGHHRYSTALMYRDYLAGNGRLEENHPANYTSAMFVSMSEPGLLVLPTHRVIVNLKPLSLTDLAEMLKDRFHFRWLDNWRCTDQIEQTVNQTGGQAFAFVHSDQSRCLIVWPKQPEHLLDDLADTYTPAWRTLPVAILHKYILHRVVYPKWLDQATAKIEYFHLASQAKAFIRSVPSALAVFVPATPVDSVRNVCADRLLMPQKSTFFYPKLATGLVTYPMFD